MRFWPAEEHDHADSSDSRLRLVSRSHDDVGVGQPYHTSRRPSRRPRAYACCIGMMTMIMLDVTSTVDNCQKSLAVLFDPCHPRDARRRHSPASVMGVMEASLLLGGLFFEDEAAALRCFLAAWRRRSFSKTRKRTASRCIAARSR